MLLNGNLYERENLEDWMYLNNWTDPANHIASNKDNEIKVEKTVSPDEILDCSEDFMRIFYDFLSKYCYSQPQST